MKLPRLDQPQRYGGLYIFDFGEWTAVGYTAEEIATLLESEQYRGGKIYKIVRASPNGDFELRGVSPQRFQLESGLFFSRDSLEAARTDYDELFRLGEDGAPCRAYIQLVDRGAEAGAQPGRYATALVYPAEYEEEIARWLSEAGYAGGDTAEGGVSHVTNYYEQPKTNLERQQLWSRPAIPSRSREDVFANVRVAVQR